MSKIFSIKLLGRRKQKKGERVRRKTTGTVGCSVFSPSSTRGFQKVEGKKVKKEHVVVAGVLTAAAAALRERKKKPSLSRSFPVTMASVR